jgi:ABC-type multidrug transport system fused ATPase/permease subunit
VNFIAALQDPVLFSGTLRSNLDPWDQHDDAEQYFPLNCTLNYTYALQDPVLFSGTLRSNLDPWDQHDDAELWRVLSAVQLKAAIRAAGGLHIRMAEAGDNLSVGQRQLFCLAR